MTTNVPEELRRSGPLAVALGPLLAAAKNLLPAIPYLGAGQEILGALIDFATVSEPWGTVAGLKGRLVPAFTIAEAIVTRTPNTDDDAIVAQGKALLQNDGLLEFVAGLIGRFQATNPAATPEGLLAFVNSEDLRAELAEAVAERQLDWSTIVQAIELIMKIIAMFKGASTPATPAAETKPGGNAWGF